jgi:hypothetical protein
MKFVLQSFKQEGFTLFHYLQEAPFIYNATYFFSCSLYSIITRMQLGFSA